MVMPRASLMWRRFHPASIAILAQEPSHFLLARAWTQDCRVVRVCLCVLLWVPTTQLHWMYGVCHFGCSCGCQNSSLKLARRAWSARADSRWVREKDKQRMRDRGPLVNGTNQWYVQVAAKGVISQAGAFAWFISVAFWVCLELTAARQSCHNSASPLLWLCATQHSLSVLCILLPARTGSVPVTFSLFRVL